jgi:hypothetical protein
MAISKQFAGATIRKPGAYSVSNVSPAGGSASSTTGVLMVIGEADAGTPSSAEGIQSYSAAGFAALAAKYRTGPLVDAAKAALAPSLTPGVNGAATILVYKTNASAQATYSLLDTYGTLTAKEYGVGGNRITYKTVLTAETPAAAVGSAAVTNFVGLDTETLIVAQNGAAPVTVTFASPTDMADVVSQINSALTGIVASGASILTLTQTATANHQRDGFGHSFEILATSTALAKLFLVAGLVVPAVEPAAAITVTQPRDGIIEANVVGGDIALMLGRSAVGSCTAATVTVSGTQITLAQTGATPASVVLTYANYPLLGNLADAIAGIAGWSVSITAKNRLLPSTVLDYVSTVGAFSAAGDEPARIKMDAYEVAQMFAASSLVAISAQAVKGLPDAEGPASLTGGAKGASATSDFANALQAALAQDLNVIVPAISQDATADITAGITDPASTYDIEAVHALLVSHLNLRGDIQNRREAQGVVGYRVPTKEAAFEQAAGLNEYALQLVMQDVLVVDATNTLAWKQPHVMAALIAGIRVGTPIGEPETFKYLAVSGVGHYVNPTTGAVGGDFNPQTDYDDAISAGVTFAEPNAGAYRIVVDNTTYGIDQSFVFNRGSVVEASQYIAKTIRSDAEQTFVGRKTTVATASSIKNRIRSQLINLFNAQILSPSTDAPQGFVEDTFIVTVEGNTATVQLECKPVQGLDFIFITFTLGDTQQSA